MNRLRFFPLAVLLIFILSACIQAVPKPVSTQDKQGSPPPQKTTAATDNNVVADNVDNQVVAEDADNKVVIEDMSPAKPKMSNPPSGSAPSAPQVALVVPGAAEKPKAAPGTSAKKMEPTPPKPVVNSNPDKAAAQPVGEGSAAGAKESNDPATEIPLTPKKIQSLLDEALDFCQAAQDFWQKGELENALEALDQAYSLILKIDSPDIKPELIQQKEDLRLIISKRILEIYASRNIVANGKHNAIPLVVNKYIQAEIDLFTTGREKKFFIDSYRRSGRYHDYIVSELRKAGLPEELSWLPLIESGFKVNALSRARALGLWQFIPSTGFKFGLKRDVFIDERMDPEKATQAAIAYLKELHQIFGDWTTALAAYNCGEGRVLRVIKSQNVNYLDDFWDLFERLPFETARYVPRFLATLHVLNNKERYGLDSVTVDPPFEFEISTVTKQMHLRDIASILGIDLADLTELNPELRYKILPRELYQLRVPPGKAEELLAKLDDIPVSSRPQPDYVNHRVRSGESLSGIANRYRTSVSSIARANNIHRHNFIVAGQVLKIPQGGSYQPPAQTIVPEKPPATHTVRSGDSLWIIAKRYGTTTKEIQELNKLNSTMLSIGQVLHLSGKTEEAPPREELKTYQVKHGDSPFKISQQFKMPLEQFLRINQLTPRSKIYPGQKLYIE
ncbi:MAG: LysM peptidoglycan-binding domain-containing protein [Desulfobacterales bacterium]|nr:LysM peptidoglycan-binding domain-containing protein [Desulfobacterales bacterium]